EQLVDCVLVAVGEAGHRASDLFPNLPDETRRAGVSGVGTGVGEQIAEVAVVEVRMVEPVMLSLLAIVLAEGLAEARQRIDQPFRIDRRATARKLAHEPIHVLQLPLSRPAYVLRSPLRLRIEPDGERLGKVLIRMALGVPVVEMVDEAFAVGFWRVVLG